MSAVMQTPKKPKQDFSLGAVVVIGGNQYRVTGHKPAPAKGKAPIAELESLDGTRRYEWQPFGGLRVIGAPPKRVRHRRKKTKTVVMVPPVANEEPGEKPRLWVRLVRAWRG